jgi:hypothetical protein
MAGRDVAEMALMHQKDVSSVAEWQLGILVLKFLP